MAKKTIHLLNELQVSMSEKFPPTTSRKSCIYRWIESLQLWSVQQKLVLEVLSQQVPSLASPLNSSLTPGADRKKRVIVIRENNHPIMATDSLSGAVVA